MSRLRVLVLAPFCNPKGISIPFVAYSHAAALARIHDVSLVVGGAVDMAVREADASFHSIETIRMPRLDRIYNWCFHVLFRSNFASQALTGFNYPFTLAFEYFAWRQLRRRVRAGEFDVVLRVLPLTAVLPSPFAFFLRKGPVPFVIGPISGGLPFVEGFKQAQKQREWVSGLRKLYRFLPFAHSTYRDATAIIAASSQTYAEFAAYRDKLFFVPENGVTTELCAEGHPATEPRGLLQLIFVGGLIPCKACDLGLRAATPLLKAGRAQFSILGDGPDRAELEALARSLGVGHAVTFAGWVSHAEVIRRLRSADVLVFPSIRDFGAGVVYEALATGVVPLVVDFGGPGDIVRPEIGYKVPLTNERDVVDQIERILATLADENGLLASMRLQGMAYAREHLTWEAKARQTTGVLNWVVRRGPRPELPPPKVLVIGGVRTPTVCS